jgi:hypothetical protein
MSRASELADRLRQKYSGAIVDLHAADELERLDRVNAELVEARDLYKTRCIEAEVFAGTLAVHVLGHFAMPDQNSEAICKQWAENIQRQHSEHVAERAALTSATKETK